MKQFEFNFNVVLDLKKTWQSKNKINFIFGADFKQNKILIENIVCLSSEEVKIKLEKHCTCINNVHKTMSKYL